MPMKTRNMRKLTVVTPCSYTELNDLKESMRFDLIDTWYIVYDTSCHEPFVKRFDHPQIVEMECEDVSPFQNACLNKALDNITEGLVYFLDEDDSVHPDFWELSRSFVSGHIYTFDMQYSDGRVMVGNDPYGNRIKRPQCVVDVALVGSRRWLFGEREADGTFFNRILENHDDKWVYYARVAAKRV